MLLYNNAFLAEDHLGLPDLNVGSEGSVVGYDGDAPVVRFRVKDGGRPVDLTHTHDNSKLVLAMERS